MTPSLAVHQGTPPDWKAIHDDVLDTGGVIVKKLFSQAAVETLNLETDQFLADNPGTGLPSTGSESYDKFSGYRTVRLHGLILKMASALGWIGHVDLLAWAKKSMSPISTSVLLNAGEMIQIGSGEPQQFLHRDTDSWPVQAIDGVPVVVNAIIALSEFTEDNGATVVVPNSWNWDKARKAATQECCQAVMSPGDALLFRGDILHGGGANQAELPRRGISISYCAGWLRPVENCYLNHSIDVVKKLPEDVQALLGFHAYDGTAHNNGVIGLYENGDPRVLLNTSDGED